jgi:hypothetical protein
MRLLEQDQLDNLPSSHGAMAAVRYARDCIGGDSRRAVRNVITQLKVLDIGRHAFPVSVNDGEELADNSYVVSPRNTYSGYAKFEIGRLPRRWLAWPLDRLASSMGRRLEAARVDRVVQLNNWLLSTNVYPVGWDGDELAQLTGMLVEQFPDHGLCWRSLNRFSNAALIDRMVSQGYLPVPSRQVWLFDGRRGGRSAFLRHHNTRLDAALRRRMPYDLVPGNALDDADFVRLEQLYNLLYLEKYCELNPQFTATWLRCGQRDGWLQLHALRNGEGRIDGVLGWVGNDQVLTAPIVGYDTTLPRRLGLYRLITQLCLQEAARRETLLNFSSGAAHFKRLRGGQPEIEYSLVYVRHLPAARQRTWTMLSRTLQGLGVPLMRRLQL